MTIDEYATQLDSSLTQELKKWEEETLLLVKQRGCKDRVASLKRSKHPTIALTFDDAPDPVTTPQILAILKKYHIRAAFFMIGEQMDSNALLVKQAHKEGHLVLNHTFTHPRLTEISVPMVIEEIERTNDEIEKHIGKRAHLVRPPYGSLSPEVVNAFDQNGMRVVLWSFDALDWALHHKDEVVHRVVDGVKSGDIVLMHSNGTNSLSALALPEIIEGLRAKGFRFQRVDKMVQLAPYKRK